MRDSELQISVIVLNYNTREMTLDCLRVLHRELAETPAEVWVVDNGSSDGSSSAIRREFPTVRLIENERNLGFGAANNQAMRQARGSLFLLLNSDAFLLPGALGSMVRYLQRHPRAGVVGPRLLNADGSLQPSCWRFPSPTRAWLENLGIAAAFSRHPVVGDYRRWAHDEERSVEFVSGACFMVRREVFEQVGGFDERFFMYSEETDWQHRMRTGGWEIGFTPAAEVTHLGGASGAAEPARINRHFFESLDYYAWKHHGLSGLVTLRAAMVVGSTARALLWSFRSLLGSRSRDIAVTKVKLYAWLVRRQLVSWPGPMGPHEIERH